MKSCLSYHLFTLTWYSVTAGTSIFVLFSIHQELQQNRCIETIWLDNCEELFIIEKLLALSYLFIRERLEQWRLAKNKIHYIFQDILKTFLYKKYLHVFPVFCFLFVSSLILALKNRKRKLCWGFLHVHCVHLLAILSKVFGGIFHCHKSCTFEIFSLEDINPNCKTHTVPHN